MVATFLLGAHSRRQALNLLYRRTARARSIMRVVMLGLVALFGEIASYSFPQLLAPSQLLVLSRGTVFLIWKCVPRPQVPNHHES